jgi:hypothetical protein
MKPATAEPAASPSWAWRATNFPLDELLQVESIWGLSDRVVGVATHLDSHYFPTFTGEAGWPLSHAPEGISRYLGGTVVDDRAWFLAYEPGLRRSESSLRLFGTNGDENGNWEALGPSNLDPDMPIRFLEHVDRTWVTAFVGEGGNIEIGAPQYLRYSRDGVHWSAARIPSLRGVDPFDVSFNEAASTQAFIVIHASVKRSGVENDVLLVSEDGVNWRETRPPGEVDWHAALACGERACVLTPFAWETHDLPYPVPIAWVSIDGVVWTPSETALADASSGGGITYVTPADRGYVGIESGRAGIVWVSSPDGSIWRRYDALSASLDVPIIGLAFGGGYVVALEQGPDVTPQRAWVGSLAAMRIGDE